MVVRRPTRGILPVDVRTTGCPQVPRELVLELIAEWELRPRARKAKVKDLPDKQEMVQ